MRFIFAKDHFKNPIGKKKHMEVFMPFVHINVSTNIITELPKKYFITEIDFGENKQKFLNLIESLSSI